MRRILPVSLCVALCLWFSSSTASAQVILPGSGIGVAGIYGGGLSGGGQVVGFIPAGHSVSYGHSNSLGAGVAPVRYGAPTGFGYSNLSYGGGYGVPGTMVRYYYRVPVYVVRPKASGCGVCQ